MQIEDLSVLEDLDHEVGIEYLDDDLSELQSFLLQQTLSQTNSKLFGSKNQKS